MHPPVQTLRVETPTARTAPRPSARMRVAIEDFRVTELMSVQPADTGEHFWLRVRKTGISTPALVRRMAEVLDVDARDIGYAGLKDERSVSEQWLSVQPGADRVVATGRLDADIEVLEVVRQTRKLRRGMHSGNHFRIVLQGVQENPGISGDWQFPNYFGTRRFGTDNVERAVDWLAHRRQRRITRFKEGIYLSVLRSLLFNAVLAHRVRDGNWAQPVAGEVLDGASLPTGPLWGRGRSLAQLQAAAIEREVLDACVSIMEGLEYAGVTQARRSLVAVATLTELEVEADRLCIGFSLPVGAYATCALAEWFNVTDLAER